MNPIVKLTRCWSLTHWWLLCEPLSFLFYSTRKECQRKIPLSCDSIRPTFYQPPCIPGIYPPPIAPCIPCSAEQCYQRNISHTKEEFLDGARQRLVVIGSLSLVISVFSVVGPCVLASVLSGKIRHLEEEGAQRDDEKRFEQLRRSFQETNALCTAFACVCTG